MPESAFRDRLTISLRVNGRDFERETSARRLLADFIRDDLGLTATHLGCEHGVCGACTVIVNGHSVRSCLMLAAQAAGAEILTVEGLARGAELHPLQRAFHECHALQCGFCTSGFLMTAYELMSGDAQLDEAAVREALSGNLCRCTGYANIVSAVMQALGARESDGK
jgi:aerobic-type carbon monoxide dehydrogenase small subunit (CoxS/CutS family)